MYSFSGVNGGKSGGNIAKALRDWTYPSKNLVNLKMTATLFRAEDVMESESEAPMNKYVNNKSARAKHDVSALASRSTKTLASAARSNSNYMRRILRKVMV